MKRLLFLVITVILNMSIAGLTWATPISYTASGLDVNGDEISGTVCIDDMIQTSIDGIYYSITAFTFNTHQYSFLGNSGKLWSPWGRDPGTVDPSDGTWALDGSGDAQFWYSPAGFFFKNADDTFIGDGNWGHISVDEYSQISPIIILPDNFSFSCQFEARSITLTMDPSDPPSVDPVPEPSSLLTLTFGIAILLTIWKISVKIKPGCFSDHEAIY